MPPFRSTIDPASETFATQREAMLALIAEVDALENKVRARSELARARFEERGQLLPRERLARLFDRGSPILSLTPLAGLGMHDDDGVENVLGGSVIAQIGFVNGTRVMAIANDSAIKGGATMPMGLKKYLRAQEIALANRLPVVLLVESAGANLAYQAELFAEGGRRFYNMAKLSAAGIPQVAIVHGSCTAGGAYLPGMSDYCIMVRGRAKVFLAGPPLLKAATGEIADDEELGGADMHGMVAGTAEFLADNDAEAIEIARNVIGSLGWQERPASQNWQEPLYSPDELAGVVPTDYRKRYDVREVVARLVDGSDFLEFKKDFGSQIFCGFAAIEGMQCGLIGNNGPIFPEAAVKAAQFIQLCSQARKSIIYLQNTTGFMVGRDAERAGIIKHGAKMIQAVSNAPVPSITLLIGGSFGAGNFGMCGRSYDPRFIFAWPNSRISIMGAEQAATVMEIVTEQKLARKGRTPDPERMAATRVAIIQKVEAESTALAATGRMWDDGIIDPRDSRRVLAFCLRTCHEAEARQLQPITFGAARL
ncbi:acyl-CoA carboxylase subunit beta [Rhodoligotrophos ferricapiens]|uniref:acyl-CoA carboxylase subunit beta n=1 Tax=Rhodoligotrophos ferricapiens TaxID=3069264 RepID=UPI00315DBBCC